MMHEKFRIHVLSHGEMIRIVAGGEGGEPVNEIDPPPPLALITIVPTPNQHSLDDD